MTNFEKLKELFINNKESISDHQLKYFIEDTMGYELRKVISSLILFLNEEYQGD